MKIPSRVSRPQLYYRKRSAGIILCFEAICSFVSQTLSEKFYNHNVLRHHRNLKDKEVFVKKVKWQVRKNENLFKTFPVNLPVMQVKPLNVVH